MYKNILMVILPEHGNSYFKIPLTVLFLKIKQIDLWKVFFW